jgi:hypothetical protein
MVKLFGKLVIHKDEILKQGLAFVGPYKPYNTRAYRKVKVQSWNPNPISRSNL